MSSIIVRIWAQVDYILQYYLWLESFSHCHLFAFVLNFSFTLHVRFRVTSCFCFEFWRSIYNFDAFEDPCFENCNGLYRCFLLSSDECWSVLVWRASFKDFSVKNCFLIVFFEIPEFAVFLRNIFAHYLTQREVNTIWSNALRGLIFAGIIFREVREFFRKFAKINPRENFKNLLIREI